MPRRRRGRPARHQSVPRVCCPAVGAASLLGGDSRRTCGCLFVGRGSAADGLSGRPLGVGAGGSRGRRLGVTRRLGRVTRRLGRVTRRRLPVGDGPGCSPACAGLSAGSLPKPVQVVAAGALVGVDPGGWDDLGVAVGGHPDLPVALVDQGVVIAAQSRRRWPGWWVRRSPKTRCGGSRTSGRAGRSRGKRIRRRAGRRRGGCRWARCGWPGRCPAVRRPSRGRRG